MKNEKRKRLPTPKVIILMGSEKDIAHCRKIALTLRKFTLSSVLRVGSAHKSPRHVIDLLNQYEKEDAIFITVAGRSNALSGFVDANTSKPVIACPPYSDTFAGADLFSTLRMPSGVAPLVVLEPEQAALATAKIFALTHQKIAEKIKAYQQDKRRKIMEADKKQQQKRR